MTNRKELLESSRMAEGENMKPEIRTIDGCYAEIKSDDPNTAITRRAIRRAVSEGDIPSRRIGTKYLVDKNEVLSYFTGA